MRKTLEDYPNLVKEFDFKKNSPLTPKDLSYGSGKKIWWKCITGHEWNSTVGNRTNGTNCPFCTGKKVSKENNLKFLFPKIAKEWHPTKNGKLRSEDFTKGTAKKVWWLCSKGHEWKAVIVNRTNGQNCPYCSGHKVSKENNLKFLFPEIAKEWHPTKNNNLKPEDITKSSGKKVWWKCNKKGHEWKAVISNRTNGRNCPFCTGKKVSKENNLKFLFPKIAKEWHPTKNDKLKPEDVTKGTPKKVWWKCIRGHEWMASIYTRTSGRNCPKCSFQSSKPEFRILSELESLFKKVDSRYKFKKTEIDIFIKDINIGIEYDGSYYHKNKKISDAKKNRFLKKNLIKLIRVRHKPLIKLDSLDVIVKKDELTKKDLDNILNSIYNFCNNEQKILIKEYLNKSSFVNEESYNKYLSYFPSPIPEKSLTSLNLQFVKEWNYKKNYPLTPNSFSTKSQTKVWWKCSNNHEWIARVSNRTNGRNCPFCTGKKVSKENNLKFLFPKIAKEWHPTKNDNLKPEAVTKSSNKKVWWKCSNNHEWKSSVNNRTYGQNCPYCSGRNASKENNLKLLFPEIAKEWHLTKNNNLKPEDVTKRSDKKVWWKCIKGHEWKTVISSRTNGRNCPFCTGKKVSKENNLKFLFPKIAKEWHPTKNNNLKPEDITKSSSKKVWWKCSNNHEWIARVSSRTYHITQTNCPHCFNIKRKSLS